MRVVVRRVVVAIIAGLVILACGCLSASSAAASDPFYGRGMWIWLVGRSAGGNPAAIAAQARLNGIKTLFIKSGDGGGCWSQFNASLVRALHSAGLNVCAWQYVYGANPLAEAAVGARAVGNGADCLVIDAEAEYQGRYASAQMYIDALRAAVGRRYPVGLSTFPYADYHPGFPYSVFLGHDGAQFNLPQMYWRDIGTSVGTVYWHTYTVNRIYRRPIRPLGQTTQRRHRRRDRTVSRTLCRLPRPWPVVVGLRLGHRRRAVARTERPLHHRFSDRAAGLSAAVLRLQGRHGPMDARTPDKRHPRRANRRHLRTPNARQPQVVPGSSSNHAYRPNRSGDLARATAPAGSHGEMGGGTRISPHSPHQPTRCRLRNRSHARSTILPAVSNEIRSPPGAMAGTAIAVTAPARPSCWGTGSAAVLEVA